MSELIGKKPYIKNLLGPDPALFEKLDQSTKESLIAETLRFHNINVKPVPSCRYEEFLSCTAPVSQFDTSPNRSLQVGKNKRLCTVSENGPSCDKYIPLISVAEALSTIRSS